MFFKRHVSRLLSIMRLFNSLCRLKGDGAFLVLEISFQYQEATKSAPIKFILKLGIQSTNSSTVGQSWFLVSDLYFLPLHCCQRAKTDLQNDHQFQ